MKHFLFDVTLTDELLASLSSVQQLLIPGSMLDLHVGEQGNTQGKEGQRKSEEQEKAKGTDSLRAASFPLPFL